MSHETKTKPSRREAPVKSAARRTYGKRAERAAPAEGQLWWRLVTPVVDGHKTILRPEGARFSRAEAGNFPWLWMHQSSGGGWFGGDIPQPCAVLGKVVDRAQTSEYLDVLVEYDLGDEFAAEVYQKTLRGFLPACSVGFDPIEEHHEEVDGEEVLVFDAYEVIEGSQVVVGSNPEALKRDALAYVRSLGGPVGQGSPPPPVRSAPNAPAAQVAPAPAPAPSVEDVAARIAGAVEDAVTRGVKRAIIGVGPVAEENASDPGSPGFSTITEPAAPAAAKKPDDEPGGKKMTEMKKVALTPELRMGYRAMLGGYMDGAEHHARMMEMVGEEHGHKMAHREMGLASMESAKRMVRMLDEGMDGFGGGQLPDSEEGSAEAYLGERKLPAKTDAEYLGKFVEVAQAGSRWLPRRTLAKVVERELGTSDPGEVKVKLAVLSDQSVRLRKLADDAKKAESERESEAREKAVAKLVEVGVMTPARAREAREERWSLGQIDQFQRDTLAHGGPVVPVTRVAPLSPADPAPAQPGSAPPLVAPPAPTAPGNSQPAVTEADIAKLAREMGVSPAYARAMLGAQPGQG